MLCNLPLACAASVSVGFQSKKSPKNGIFEVLAARKMGREQFVARKWGESRAAKTSKIPFFGLFSRRDVPRHVRPSHKMQRTFLNLRKSVHLVSAGALNHQAL